MNINDLVWIDATGYNYEDFPSFLLFRTQQYQNIYGTDVYLNPDSQDGQYVAAQAQADYDTAAKGAGTYNSFSPATAQGTGLSRVVKINGLEREKSSNSTVSVTIGGTSGTVITDGIAVDTLQQQWALPSPTTIPSGGSIIVTATAVEQGALQAQADTVTGIFTPTQGWQSVNNSSAATPGDPVEIDGTLRARQIVSTALPSLTVLEGTMGAVSNVPGVTAAQDYENYTDSTDSNSLPPHSISFVVAGGSDADVAAAIQIKKTPGTNTYGTTSVNTTDSNGVPITINFYRPLSAVISVKITLTPLASWVTSNENYIADAVATFINTMVKIGGNPLDAIGTFGISFSQLFGVAYVPGTPAAGSFIIEQIELKKNSGSFAAADLDMLFNEEAVCAADTNVSFVT